MASVFIYHVVGDLTVGKPEMTEFYETETVEAAIRAIGESRECGISIWRRKPLVGIENSLKNLPLIHSYSSIQALSKHINKSERDHDLVIASYVLGEIPSLKDKITKVRQLWDLTRDVLVEPGTPQGSNIISQMRSHILWMEKRLSSKCRKFKYVNKETSKDLVTRKSGVPYADDNIAACIQLEEAEIDAIVIEIEAEKTSFKAAKKDLPKEA
ncbi:hypothetical protein Dsin_017195 [Dipteronia sinensis]|uniref:Uncharacterized protein n=1 Tax=Dipteronia sinensis TaxID=43782 RepID=A0AAE0AEV3_9ROSI|nr:hypothetical protein Dsin_017195 [Dipteronia sinensis]